MGHPTEDELIQHLCGENEPGDRARMQAHLSECAECRLACAEITGALTMVNDTVPEPPDDFERVVWARVQQAIASAPPAARWTWRAFVPAGALAAVAIAGIAFIGRAALAPAPTPGGSQAAATADSTPAVDRATRDHVLYTALNSHFQQTEMLLVEVRNAAAGDSLDFERVSAEELVSAGRLYRVTAEHAGYRNLAQVLDDLEPVLVEVANSPNRISKTDRQWLRTRIEEDALLFKVRAATNNVRERSGNADQE